MKDNILLIMLGIIAISFGYGVFMIDTPVEKDIAYIEALKSTNEALTDALERSISNHAGISQNVILLICSISIFAGVLMFLVYLWHCRKIEAIRTQRAMMVLEFKKSDPVIFENAEKQIGYEFIDRSF